MTYPDIQDLLPHEPPMLWLDEVVHRDGDEVRCTLTIREDHAFVHDGMVEPLVSVEWMAQSVAALVGMFDRSQQQTPRPGYLIAVPEATFDVDRFGIGDALLITARRIWGDDELASFECSVKRGDDTVVRGQLSVYRRALPGSKTS